MASPPGAAPLASGRGLQCVPCCPPHVAVLLLLLTVTPPSPSVKDSGGCHFRDATCPLEALKASSPGGGGSWQSCRDRRAADKGRTRPAAGSSRGPPTCRPAAPADSDLKGTRHSQTLPSILGGGGEGCAPGGSSRLPPASGRAGSAQHPLTKRRLQEEGRLAGHPGGAGLVRGRRGGRQGGASVSRLLRTSGLIRHRKAAARHGRRLTLSHPQAGGQAGGPPLSPRPPEGSARCPRPACPTSSLKAASPPGPRGGSQQPPCNSHGSLTQGPSPLLPHPCPARSQEAELRSGAAAVPPGLLAGRGSLRHSGAPPSPPSNYRAHLAQPKAEDRQGLLPPGAPGSCGRNPANQASERSLSVAGSPLGSAPQALQGTVGGRGCLPALRTWLATLEKAQTGSSWQPWTGCSPPSFDA